MRITRSRRIGGKRTAKRRCASGRAIVAALAIAGAATLAPASAQHAGPFVYDLFSGDSVDVDPVEARKLADEARKALTPGDCPVGRLTVFAGEGDNLFQEALAKARRDKVLLYLDGQGIDASRFFANTKVFGAEENSTDVQLEYGLPDRIPPQINVTSTPEKGKKVTPNQRITVKAIARDDVGSWQSGVKTIDLEAEGGQLFGFEDYPQSCDSPPPPQTLDGVYVVPANPPPVVRLRAVAKDFAGNRSELAAEFPTGDWYGSLKFSSEGVVRGVTTTITDHMDIVLDYDGQGNLTGSLVGNRSFTVQNHPDCNWAVTIPSKLRGKLVGSYTPGANVMSIQLIEPEVAPAPRKNCPGGGYIHSGGSIHDDSNFESALRSPSATGAGKFQSDVTWMTGPITNSISLRLQRAQN